MKRVLLLSLALWALFAVGCRPSPATAIGEAVTPEAETDWITLFNGKDLTGWDIKLAGRPLNDNYRNTFRVEEGMLRVRYDDYENFDGLYGHLYYRQPYTRYKLRFDYRFVGNQTPGGASWNVRNSGVMLHSQPAASNERAQTFPVSVEMQLLGGLNRGTRTTGNVCTPGTAVVLGDTVDYRHCINSSSATYDGDDWVRAEAIVLGGEAMHFLIEGDTVLSFRQPQIGGGFTTGNSDQSDWEAAAIFTSRQDWLDRRGQILTDGYIALQAESHPIDFRNIRLLDLTEHPQ